MIATHPSDLPLGVQEIEKLWKMVDAAHEKESRARDTVNQLKMEIANLTKLVEQGAGLSLGQDARYVCTCVSTILRVSACDEHKPMYVHVVECGSATVNNLSALFLSLSLSLSLSVCVCVCVCVFVWLCFLCVVVLYPLKLCGLIDFLVLVSQKKKMRT